MSGYYPSLATSGPEAALRAGVVPPGGSTGSHDEVMMLSDASTDTHSHTRTHTHTLAWHGQVVHASSGALAYPVPGGGSTSEESDDMLGDGEPASTASSRRLVAAARRGEGMFGSTLGTLSLNSRSVMHAGSLLHADDDEEYLNQFDDDDAVAPRDDDESMRNDSEYEDDGAVTPSRRGHVRINSRPLVITYTPKTAMTESEAGSVCSSPGSYLESGSESGGTSPGGMLSLEAAAPTPGSDLPLVAGLRICAVRANADAAALGLSGEDPTPGRAGLRIGVRRAPEPDASAAELGLPAASFTPGGGRPPSLSLSLKSPAATAAYPLTEAELAYQQSTSLSPSRCGIAARLRGPRLAAAPAVASGSDDSSDERAGHRCVRRSVEGFAGMSGGGHATSVAVTGSLRISATTAPKSPAGVVHGVFATATTSLHRHSDAAPPPPITGAASPWGAAPESIAASGASWSHAVAPPAPFASNAMDMTDAASIHGLSIGVPLSSKSPRCSPTGLHAGALPTMAWKPAADGPYPAAPVPGLIARTPTGGSAGGEEALGPL